MYRDGKFLVVAPPEGRALWLRHDGSSIHLMASTHFVPALLVLPVDECFEVRVLHLDRRSNCLYVRSLRDDEHYDHLNSILTDAATEKTVSSRNAILQPLSMSTVYMVRTEAGYRRMVLVQKGENVTPLMYGIDDGKMYRVNVADVLELSPSLRRVPPLCFCVVLESCSNSSMCEEFAQFKEGTICICKICNEFPSNYPQRAKEMYPPAIISKIYEIKGQGFFAEISCTMKIAGNTPIPSALIRRIGSSSTVVRRKNVPLHEKDIRSSRSGGNSMKRRRCRTLVVKSASALAITRDPSLPFMFQKFSVSLPADLKARVTERIDNDIYLMRKTELVDELEKRLVVATTPLVPRLCFDRGVCCLVRLIRPVRSKYSTRQPKLYRAIASCYHPEDRLCDVMLVDFGQTLVCSVSDLFELHDQPVEVREMPTASFRCQVKKFLPFKRNKNKTIKLLDENDYNVCLTLRCERYMYWAEVTLSNTDFVLYYNKSRVHPEIDQKTSKVDIDAVRYQKGSIGNVVKNDVMLHFKRRKEKLQEELEQLLKNEEMLRKEKKDFANESIKRQQKIQATAMHVQLFNPPTKTDMITSINNSGFLEANAPNAYIRRDGDVSTGFINEYVQSKLNNNAAIVEEQYSGARNQPIRHPTASTRIKDKAISNTNMRSSKSYATNAQVLDSNGWDGYRYRNADYRRHVTKNALTRKYHSSNMASFASSRTCRPILSLDASDNATMYPQRMSFSRNDNDASASFLRSGQEIKDIPLSMKGIFMAPKRSSMFFTSMADSFGDSYCKVNYGQPPQRTTTDYFSSVQKQSQQSAPGSSLNTISENDSEMTEALDRQVAVVKQENSLNPVKTISLLGGKVDELIYTSDESINSEQSCNATNDSQQRNTFVPTEHQLSPRLDTDESLPHTYQMNHEFIKIIKGTKMDVRRVGAESDWPIFFVIPDGAQYRSLEYFDALYPTQKLSDTEFRVGLLCATQCSDRGGTKVRAVIERFNEKVVNVRHIDHGHVETVKRNELWSVENLSPSVRKHPALAVPCILASLNEVKQSDEAVRCRMNEVHPVGQLMRLLFKAQRDVDGIWIVELIKE